MRKVKSKNRIFNLKENGISMKEERKNEEAIEKLEERKNA